MSENGFLDNRPFEAYGLLYLAFTGDARACERLRSRFMGIYQKAAWDIFMRGWTIVDATNWRTGPQMIENEPGRWGYPAIPWESGDWWNASLEPGHIWNIDPRVEDAFKTLDKFITQQPMSKDTKQNG